MLLFYLSDDVNSPITELRGKYQRTTMLIHESSFAIKRSKSPVEPPDYKGPRHAIYRFKVFKFNHRMFFIHLNSLDGEKDQSNERRKTTYNAA